MSVGCDVYTRLLFPRGFGHPLWEPEPTEAGEVLIGDVGYILDGGFYRLFNAALSSDDPVNKRYGVPDDFEPFTIPDTLRHRRKQALEAGPICSKNVTVLNVEGELAGNVGVRSNLRFKLTDEQGAILVLEHPADREVLHPCKDLTQYIVRHHASWHEFAQNVFRLDIGADRIVFVTGWVKTARWALAAATHHARDVEISFGGVLGPFFNMSLIVSATQDASMLWEHRFGPKAADYATAGRAQKGEEKADEEASPPSLDQCLFLHYYMVRHRRFLGPKVMKAQAGYQELSDGGSPAGGEPGLVSSSIDEECAAESPQAEVEMVPGVRSDSDEGSKSVEFILDYILDKTDANCAIASDMDLLSFGKESPGLQGDQFVELEDYDIPENISQLLDEVRPSLSVIDGIGMLSWHDMPVPTPYPSPSRGRDATLVRPLVQRRSRSRSSLARHRSGSRSSKSPAPLACFSAPAASVSPLQPIGEAVTSNPGLVGTGTHRDNLALPKKRKREGTSPTPTASKRAAEVQDTPGDETNIGSPSSGSRPKRLQLGIVPAGDQLSPTSRMGPPLPRESPKHSPGDGDPDEPSPLKKKGMRGAS